MGSITSFQPLKLFIGILCSETVSLSAILEKLEHLFGPISLKSNPFPYTHSSYYDSEMGPSLIKCFIVFETLIKPEIMASIKLRTNKIEDEFLNNLNRSVNLDPGILSLHNLVLLSTKNFYHRIPLQDGIYAELTLTYSNRTYHTLPWTYPDFKFDSYQSFFLAVRKEYHAQLLT